MKRPNQTTPARKNAPNGGPGRLASEGEADGTVDPNDSGGKPVPTVDEPRLDPQIVPPPNTGARP
ncbi:MAG TPA: hypothetical protein VFS43_31400 [Polyangiaceae bacterium]|nr:hypothetical protein [Polyangiaceae bacterium]